MFHLRFATILLIAGILNVCATQDLFEVDISTISLNSTTEDSVIYYPLNVSEVDLQETLSDDAKKTSNISHLKTGNVPKDWNEHRIKLTFPKLPLDDRYKMTMLHLDKGFFIFDFLRVFLSFVQPYDLPVDILKDAVDHRITASKLVSQSLHMEAAFISLIGICGLLMFVTPSTELWLACRPTKQDYKPPRHPGALSFLLTIFVLIMGVCIITMIVSNEAVGAGIEKIPVVVETALQDLGDYHAGTTIQLRKCLTQSLDVASEAILVDIDNVEDLLGKPVQKELAYETGLDVALDALLDVANATHELSTRTATLLKEGERARNLGIELSREADDIRRELEVTAKGCPQQDRSLCAILNPSGLNLALRLERLVRDDRLLRLKASTGENLTEAARQARGEYLYVPNHVSRITLDARNQIRREINGIRAKIFDEARNIETSSTGLSKQLDSTRNIANQIIPYITVFEQMRWLVGIGSVMCVLLVWSLLLGAICCRCGTSENRVRTTLLCAVLFSCIISIGLWLVIMCALALSSHAEMLLCRPLYDPEYRTMEAILETQAFLGRRMSVPLKDLFEKCQQNEAAYPAFQLGSSIKLDQLTAHWTWTGLSRAFSKLRVDLKGLRILTPSLQHRLQNLFYACSSNLTEHRIMIQGPILNKDLNALSDQVSNVARQLSDRKVARDLQSISTSMRELLLRRVKPLMKIQDELVYQLAGLQLQLQPLQRQVNQSISHLKTIQYYIDNQGIKIAQLKTKSYVERLVGYLDQWRGHVLLEMGNGIAKCRPLWDILHGVQLLVCQHILGPLNGFWFAVFICAMTLMASTPTAHFLAATYKKESFDKKSQLIPQRMESPDTVIIDRGTWRTPEPPPSDDGW
ncbi:prominin-2 isoform X2 [Leptopilina boulardi]|uniref:prominin-2 isoform X2 n=1 Tax=Leptopilina boulardi TaxID=63433 RepID=UPI0021F550B5|nr:prominin-2 isoform X2 [Leptopilina boulardi]